MYRNEDKRAEADKWQGWTDVFQFGTLGLLFVTMFILNSLPKAEAKAVVWYFAGVLFILATTGFLLGRVAIKKQSTYMKAEQERLTGLFDIAIKQTKGK